MYSNIQFANNTYVNILIVNKISNWKILDCPNSVTRGSIKNYTLATLTNVMLRE